MRRKTGQIERSLCNYASEALGATSKISHFSKWHSPAQKGRGKVFFSTLSQLIASLFPNKSFGGLFFFFFSEANTSDTCKAHNQQAEDIKGIQATNKNNRDSCTLSASIPAL